MRFYTQSVTWHFVDDDTPFVSFPSPFRSGIWEETPLCDGLGEDRLTPRKYYNGKRVGNAVPKGPPCGTADQWSNGLPVPPSAPVPVSRYNVPTCCSRQCEIHEPADLDINDPCVLYWLATLILTGYGNYPDLAIRVAEGVLPPGNPISSVPNSSEVLPGFILAKMDHGAVLAVCGVTNTAQWEELILWSDLVPTAWAGRLGTSPGRVLSTFLAAANAIDTYVDAFVPPNEPILVCGHSMGGAIAQLLAAKWRWQGKHTGSKCAAFASPKIGDLDAVILVPNDHDEFIRLSVDGDAVPNLPPNTSVLGYLLPLPLVPFATRYNSCQQTFPAKHLSVD
jgi:hypothetical protein